MTRVVLHVALLALLLTPRAATGQSWPLARRDSDRLRCQALDGGPALPFQGSALSRLCGDC